MKKIFKQSWLSIIVIVLCSFSSKSMGANVEDPSFEDLFIQTMVKFENDTTSERLSTCVAELKRINVMFPENWITRYYISLYEIQQSLMNLSGDNEALLNDSYSNIEYLNKNKKADKSEVKTLEGYYYYALIAKDPANNGPAYYKNVLDAYQRALNYNAKNPRANLLLLIFKNDMAGFMGQNDEDICSKLDEIGILFQNEKKEYLKPTWGENTLVAMVQKFCGKQ